MNTCSTFRRSAALAKPCRSSVVYPNPGHCLHPPLRARTSPLAPRHSRAACASIFALLTLACSLASAQPTGPRIGYAYPAGGQQGTTFRMTLGGQFLDGATNAVASGPGIQIRVLEHRKPLTQQQFNTARDQLRELQNKRQDATRASARKRGAGTATNRVVWTAQDQKQFDDLRKKVAGFQRRPQNPAIAEKVFVQVTIPPGTPEGSHELRLATAQGLSNPLLFCVGNLPETRKPEAGADEELASFKPARNTAEQTAVTPSDLNVTLPCVINGQILQGGIDRFHFSARRGQHLVARVSARDLIPYLPDAVPGWFQAALTLYDAKGKEIAYEDDYRFHPDPVLHCEIPADGQYTLALKDAIYRGREDFVYRVTLGELPFITGIFPLGGPAGQQTTVELTGWNLPAQSLLLDNTQKSPGVYPVSVRNDDRQSNWVPFAVETFPEASDQEPNNSPPQAQAVTLPIVMNGRIERAGDADVLSFEGRAGQQVVAEVWARRLESPLDSALRLSDATGKQVAFNDDQEDKGSGLNTHHADSLLRAQLPADGTYCLRLTDAQGKGGSEYGYRLRLSEPMPDFALRVVPSTLTARGGVATPFTVYALRRDGFTNAINVVLDEAPEGFTLSGGLIPAGQDKAVMTLTCASTTRQTLPITLEGSARIGGQRVTHRAVPAEDMMQTFAYRHLVPARELRVALSDRPTLSRRPLRILSDCPVSVPAGGTARVRFSAPMAGFADRLQLELCDPPEGLLLERVSATREGGDLVLRAEAGKLKPGCEGNLIVNIVPKATASSKTKKAAPRRAAVGCLPAIPFKVVAQ